MAPLALTWFLLKSLGLPILLLYLYASYLRISAASTMAIYFFSVVVCGWTVAGVAESETRRSAARVGALVIPRVRGRIIGNLDILVIFLQRFLLETPGMYWDELAETYGNTYDLNILGLPTIWTRDPALVRHVLTGSSFNNYEKGAWFSNIFRDFLGSGIFASDREMWRAHRAMNRPYFERERLSNFDTFCRHTDHLLKVVDHLQTSLAATPLDNRGAIDCQELFGRYTLDTATSFLMGGSVSSLADVDPFGEGDGPKSESTKFLDAFNQVQQNCYRRSMLGDIWKLGDRNTAPMIVINCLVEGLIERALARPHRDASAESEGSGDETLLDSVIRNTRDPKVLKDQVLNMLLAARDTTQTTLSNSIYMLARHSNILKRLRAEILAEHGAGGTPTYASARRLVFLRAFLNEVLRLFPPIPFNVRASIGEDVVVAGDGKPYYIPARTRTTIALLNLQRRADLWGHDALQFDPDRWLDERISHYKQNPFIWTYNQASFALINILQKYDQIELALDVQPQESLVKVDEVLHIAQITLQFKGGLWVRLGEAKDLD